MPEFLERLEVLFSLKNLRRKCTIASDFNIDISKDLEYSSRKIKQKMEFINLMELYGLSPCFQNPTRITKTTIDNILTKSYQYKSYAPQTLTLDIDFSDHIPIFVSLNGETTIWVKTNKQSFKRGVFLI